LATRQSWPSLVFLLPCLLTYEIGLYVQGGADCRSLRGAADGWIIDLVERLGIQDHWWPPLLLALALLVRHALERTDWRFPPIYLVGIVLESVVFAVALVGLGRLIDLGFHRLERLPSLVASSAEPIIEFDPWLGFLGAGIYEEFVFRLILLSLILAGLSWPSIPRVVAVTLGMIGSSLAFSLAHHLGGPGEAFTWFAFVFRWSAGIFFAWVYLVRGFGIAVGTHVSYDLIVGYWGIPH
jgi:hypothetical protein